MRCATTLRGHFERTVRCTTQKFDAVAPFIAEPAHLGLPEQFVCEVCGSPARPRRPHGAGRGASCSFNGATERCALGAPLGWSNRLDEQTGSL